MNFFNTIMVYLVRLGMFSLFIVIIIGLLEFLVDLVKIIF